MTWGGGHGSSNHFSCGSEGVNAALLAVGWTWSLCSNWRHPCFAGLYSTLKNSVYRALVILCNPLQPGSPEEKIIHWTNNLWYSALLQASFAALTVCILSVNGEVLYCGLLGNKFFALIFLGHF